MHTISHRCRVDDIQEYEHPLKYILHRIAYGGISKFTAMHSSTSGMEMQVLQQMLLLEEEPVLQ